VDIFGYLWILVGYMLWISKGYLEWIFHLDINGYNIDIAWISFMDINWISLRTSKGYLHG
jgi:hypothetical protein